MAKAPNEVTVSLETGMLAYARSIQISEGLFFAKNAANEGIGRVPVEVLVKGVRGQTSQDNAKEKAGLSNPQSVEFAAVPTGCDTVELEFSVRIMPLSAKPHACGNTSVGESYAQLAAEYKKAGGYDVLASLYLWNIANGRFAWRNRFQADDMTVTVAFYGEEVSFDPFKLNLHTPDDQGTLCRALSSGTVEQVARLIGTIAEGLSEKAVFFTVTWSAKMSPGQEIFPSQEYIRESIAEKDMSRVYAKLPTFFRGREVMQASMHSQKIGAALRHIDIWHGDEIYGAIAVNPYGGVQETSAVLRAPKTKQSFYDIRAKADVLIEGLCAAEDAAGISADAHFVMANLIRGGVLGSSSKKAEANG
jgi:CRISPR-associated protein Csy3